MHALALYISDQVGVASISTVGLVVIAIIQNFGLRRKAEKTKRAAELTALNTDAKAEEVKQMVTANLGSANGNGTVVEMLERIDERTELFHERQLGLASRVDAVHDVVIEHIKRYDLEHPHHVDPPVRGPGRVRPL